MRALLLALVACSAAPEQPPPPDVRALGMNDVSILVPLPADRATPVIAKLDHAAPSMLPVNLVVSLAIASEIGPKGGRGDVAYDDFHVVAIRFDPCARDHLGPCTSGEDGRLRLILQPLYLLSDKVAGHDIALHAFYRIPQAELPAVVDELRELAAIQNAPLDAPLQQSPALVADPDGAYADALRSLVGRYARTDNLVQLTTIGQDELSNAFAWIFAGFVKQGDAWQPIQIPALTNATRQHVRVGGGDTVYESEPAADFPFGLGTAANGTLWAQASDEERRIAVEALAEIENPTRHDANDSQCMACHISTYLSVKRSQQLGIDPATRAREFSTTWNTKVDSFADKDARSVRAFGYADDLPAISRRVANDTAYVLDEIDKRWPSYNTTPSR